MTSDFLTTRELHHLAPNTEFFRLLPVERELSMMLAVEGGTVVGIAVNRDRGGFTETDRALLTLLCERPRRALSPIRHDGDERLSAREADVLRLVAHGRTNAAIAHQLGISPRTVAKHLEHIYRKLDVTCRSAAVAEAGPLVVGRSANRRSRSSPAREIGSVRRS